MNWLNVSVITSYKTLKTQTKYHQKISMTVIKFPNQKTKTKLPRTVIISLKQTKKHCYFQLIFVYPIIKFGTVIQFGFKHY